jgi:two-component system chemotaxis response regulator CheB
MPAAFTPAFAQRLNTLCDVQVKEAEDGERLVNGTIYIAPGGKQTMLGGTSGSLKLVVRESEAHLNYKPCVDVTLASIARLLGRETLSIILTGMGADGREGCKLIKAKGATVWAQDEASCVVYGMPMAVATAGLTDEIVSLEDIGRRLAKELA